MSAVAQHDNLGDLVLRKVVIEWARASGRQIHLLHDPSATGFVEALALPPDVVMYQASTAWLSQLLKRSIRDRPAIMYSPGPQSLALSRGESLHGVTNAAVSLWLNKQHGPIIKLGRSFHGDSHLLRTLEARVARASSLYTVRDARSSGRLTVPQIQVRPDIAIAEPLRLLAEPQPMSSREIFALSFRDGDRASIDAEMTAAVELAGKRGLEPWLVTQVRRDNVLHRHLAQRYAINHCAWPSDVSESEQLRRVADCYSRARAVVTDRLHSALFGLMQGAIPLGRYGRGHTKLRDSMETLGLAHLAQPSGASDNLKSGFSDSTQEECQGALARARLDLTELRETVLQVLGAP